MLRYFNTWLSWKIGSGEFSSRRYLSPGEIRRSPAQNGTPGYATNKRIKSDKLRLAQKREHENEFVRHIRRANNKERKHYSRASAQSFFIPHTLSGEILSGESDEFS